MFTNPRKDDQRKRSLGPGSTQGRATIFRGTPTGSLNGASPRDPSTMTPVIVWHKDAKYAWATEVPSVVLVVQRVSFGSWCVVRCDVAECPRGMGCVTLSLDPSLRPFDFFFCASVSFLFLPLFSSHHLFHHPFIPSRTIPPSYYFTSFHPPIPPSTSLNQTPSAMYA